MRVLEGGASLLSLKRESKKNLIEKLVDNTTNFKKR